MDTEDHPDDDPARRDTGEVVYDGRFDTESAREARNLGMRQATLEAEERRAFVLGRINVLEDLLGAYDQYLPAANLARLFKAAGARVAHDVLTGQIKVTSASQAAALITALSTAGRLEAGEVTSRAATVSPEEEAERIRELRDAAQRALDATEKATEAAKVVPLTGA